MGSKCVCDLGSSQVTEGKERKGKARKKGDGMEFRREFASLTLGG